MIPFFVECIYTVYTQQSRVPFSLFVDTCKWNRKSSNEKIPLWKQWVLGPDLSDPVSANVIRHKCIATWIGMMMLLTATTTETNPFRLILVHPSIVITLKGARYKQSYMDYWITSIHIELTVRNLKKQNRYKLNKHPFSILLKTHLRADKESANPVSK